MRAAIYTRISLDRAGKRAGVERQRTDCEALCERRSWTVVEVLEDNDRSAYSGRERPAYQQLVGLVAAGDVDVVVAWHSDRLWRNVMEQQTFLAVGQRAGLKLVATPSTDFDPADADDEFMSTLLTAVAKKESADKSRRMARRQLEKANRGEHHGGRRAFGHTLDRTELVDREADAIRDAAKRVLSGGSIYSVALEWNENGLTTTAGGRWTSDTVVALLSQPRLAGLRAHHGEIVGEAQWPAIIDTDTHEQLVHLFDARKRGPRQVEPRKGLLVGLLRCSKCEGPMRRTVATKDNPIRYACNPRSLGGCAGVTVLADKADETARDLVLEYLDSEDFAAALGRARAAAASANHTARSLTTELDRDRAKLAQLGDDYADGIIDRAEYARLTGRIRDRIEANERKLRRVSSVQGPAADMQGQGHILAVAWSRMTLDERRTVLRAVVDHFTVRPAIVPRNVFRPERVRPAWRFETR